MFVSISTKCYPTQLRWLLSMHVLIAVMNWKAYVESMRDRLQQVYAQAPLAFESEVYHQWELIPSNRSHCDEICTHTNVDCDRNSTTLRRRVAPESRAHQDVDISVIMSNVKGLAKKKMRMVVKRNGRLGTLCLDCKCTALEHSILQTI